MIAATPIPAAAAAGIGVVWGNPTIALGALVLLIVSAVSIHVSGVAVFWYLGYQPEAWDTDNLLANVSIRNFGSSIAVALVLVVLFATAGGVLSTHIGFERSANIAVEQTLAKDQYDELELEGVQAVFNPGPLFSESQEVTVTVRRPSNQNYAKLSGQLRQRIICLLYYVSVNYNLTLETKQLVKGIHPIQSFLSQCCNTTPTPGLSKLLLEQ
ncbi:hypothetical protein SAMN04487948_1506 [Halogranum amylolyticum]|uniref:Uncharacterized protein n=2 Tax=Halogranum amylolyticum TaxID=660520 RepID=A0A1H8WWP8_9EURY|nr:hypothetical protein SAMN04487948_1506 [Halogranum amylolyticum]